MDDDPWSALHVDCVERLLGTLNAAVYEGTRINLAVKKGAVMAEEVEGVRTQLRAAISRAGAELKWAETLYEHLSEAGGR